MSDYTVIIPAAGQGTRMNAGKNKMLLELDNQPIFIHTVRVFECDPSCTEIIIVVNKKEEEMISSFLLPFSFQTKIIFVHGGAERQDSVYNGLCAVSGDYVLVHDGARPFITREIISNLVEETSKHGSAICGVPVKDTTKKVIDGVVTETIERSSLWSVQTPQAFKTEILREAHELAKEEQFLGTDEASLVEKLGYPVRMVMGDYRNIKITTPEDLIIAEGFMKEDK